MRVSTFVLLATASITATAQALPLEPEMPRAATNADLVAGILSDASSITSIRNTVQNPSLIASGDTYGAAVLVQSASYAAHATISTGRVTTFAYDLAPSQHGNLAGSNAVVNMTESQTVTGPNSLQVVVTALTADSSDLWVTGLTINGEEVTEGRFDVGGGAFSNGLLWDDVPGVISSVSITNALLADGSVLASTALPNLRTLPQMGTAVIWSGVVGSGVDEAQMIFDITYVVPEPASLSLIGFGAVAMIRRRKA